MDKERTIDLGKIMSKLAQDNGIFCSEADFQFSLAQKLREEYGEFQFWLEYPIRTEENKKIYIDIFMTDGKNKYYIELKYKTKSLEYTPFKKNLELAESQSLANQSAQDIGALSYHKDIKRLETIVTEEDKTCIGYAIFLTNDPLYYQDKPYKGTEYEGCYFRNGIICKEAHEHSKSCELTQEYKSKWQTYITHQETLPNAVSEFKYIITKIERKNGTH